MKLHLEAEAAELRARAPELIERLSKALRSHVPEIADAMLKALPEKEAPELKHQALRDSMAHVQKLYGDTLDLMLAEIGQALEARVDEMEGGAKKGGPDYTTKMRSEDQKEFDAVTARVLANTDFTAEDFAPGGLLYGMSVATLNELLAKET